MPNRPFDPNKDCQKCERAVSDSENYLMRCTRCGLRYHHRCHEPPLLSSTVHTLNTRANAITRAARAAGRDPRLIPASELQGTALTWVCGPCERKALEQRTGDDGVIDLTGDDDDDVTLPAPGLPSAPGPSPVPKVEPRPPIRTTVSQIQRQMETIVLTDSDSEPEGAHELSASSGDENGSDTSIQALGNDRRPVQRHPVFPVSDSSDEEPSPERERIGLSLGVPEAGPQRKKKQRPRAARMTAGNWGVKVESEEEEEEVQFVGQGAGAGVKREVLDEKDRKKPRLNAEGEEEKFAPLSRSPSPEPIRYTADGTRIARVLPLRPYDLERPQRLPVLPLPDPIPAPPWRNPKWPPHILLSADPPPPPAPPKPKQPRKTKAKYLGDVKLEVERVWVRPWDVVLEGGRGGRRIVGGWIEVIEGWPMSGRPELRAKDREDASIRMPETGSPSFGEGAAGMVSGLIPELSRRSEEGENGKGKARASPTAAPTARTTKGKARASPISIPRTASPAQGEEPKDKGKGKGKVRWEDQDWQMEDEEEEEAEEQMRRSTSVEL